MPGLANRYDLFHLEYAVIAIIGNVKGLELYKGCFLRIKTVNTHLLAHTTHFGDTAATKPPFFLGASNEAMRQKNNEVRKD
jgi:hypothetical protein